MISVNILDLHGRYIQVALDLPDWTEQERVLSQIPDDRRIILEAGTPFIKRFGIDVVKKIKNFFPENLILADLKTLDVGSIEVNFSADAGAHLAVCSGLANASSIDKFMATARERHILGVMDLMEVVHPIEKFKQLTVYPDVVIFHRAIDAEDVQSNPEERWRMITEIKKFFGEAHPVKVAVAGGISPETGKMALDMGADILIVGRYITAADNITKATKEMLDIL